MWSQAYVKLLFTCVMALYKVDLSSCGEKTPLISKNAHLPKPEEHNIKNFNGTVFIELKEKKEVIPVEVGDKIGKVIFRVGDEKRVQFNIGKDIEETAVLTLKSYNGSVILRGGNTEIELKSKDKKRPGPQHVGLIYI